MIAIPYECQIDPGDAHLEAIAEIHAKREHELADTDLAKQKVVAAFAENVKAISALPPGERLLAFAKLLEQNPGVMEKVAELECFIDKLNLTRGLSLTPLGPASPI